MSSVTSSHVELNVEVGAEPPYSSIRLTIPKGGKGKWYVGGDNERRLPLFAGRAYPCLGCASDFGRKKDAVAHVIETDHDVSGRRFWRPSRSWRRKWTTEDERAVRRKW